MVVLVLGIVALFSVLPRPETSTSSSAPSETTATSLTSTASSASTQTGSSTSGVSPDVLQLQVMLNSTTVGEHGSVAVQIRLVNTLDRNATLAVVPNQTIAGWDAADFVCSANPSSSLVGFAVFQGDFSAQNISAAPQPLQLAPPFYPPCAIRLPINATTFLPESDEAVSRNSAVPFTGEAEINATTGYCTGSGLSGEGGSVYCGYDPGLVGYWNGSAQAGGNLNFTSPAFVYFPPGEYTMVVMDDWNLTAYAHFQVTPTPGGSPADAASLEANPLAGQGGTAVWPLAKTPPCTANPLTCTL